MTRAVRISAAAGPGEILVSADLLTDCQRAVAVTGERMLELKGIAEPLPAAVVGWDRQIEVG